MDQKYIDLAGIKTSVFGAHNTRAATTFAAKAMIMPIDILMQSAGWTQESNLRKFYNKPVVTRENIW